MKAMLNLSIDTDVLAMAKAQRFNISALVESILRNEYLADDKNGIESLKMTNAKLTVEIQRLTLELQKANKLIEDKKNESKYTRTIHIGQSRDY